MGGDEREAKRERYSESGRALAAELSQRRVATSVVAARVGAQGRGKQRRRERAVETQGRATQRAVPTHTHPTHNEHRGVAHTEPQSGTQVRRLRRGVFLRSKVAWVERRADGLRRTCTRCTPLRRREHASPRQGRAEPPKSQRQELSALPAADA